MEIYEEVRQTDKSSEDMDLFDYAKQIIASQIEIKAINDDIKQIKIEAKENGVLVKEIDAVISDIKRDLKKDPSVTLIEDDIKSKIEANQDLMDSIAFTI